MNVEQIPRHRLAGRVEEWFSGVYNGELALTFYDWLAGVAYPVRAATDGMRLRQGVHEFELRHGLRYAIDDTVRGARTFDCIIDGRVPLVAFVNENGQRAPWITVKNLFTIEEIVTMAEVPQA